MATTTTTTNKPLNPRAQDLSPKGYNRANIFSGKALSFDGVNDLVEIGSSAFSSYAQVSFAIHFRTTSGGGVIVQKENVFRLIHQGDKSLQFVLATSSNGWYSKVLTITNVDFSRDYFLSAAYDGTELKVYLNGLLVGTLGGFSGTLGTSVFNATIGSGVSSLYYSGRVSGFKMFNTALTAAQVSDLYLNPEKIVPDGVASSALKLWLPMMEGAGASAYDGSGNGNDGTINGATWTAGVGSPVAQTALVSWNKGVNLVRYSENFTNAPWTTATNNGTLVVTGNYATAPNGTQTAERIQMTQTAGGSNYSQLYQLIIGATNGVSYTWSVWLKSLSGTPTIGIGYDGNNWSTITLTTEWKEYKITKNASSTSINADLLLFGTLGTSLSADFLAWGFSLRPTSAGDAYIKTNATAQTSAVLVPEGLTAGASIFGTDIITPRNAFALNLDGASWAQVGDNASLDFGTGAFTLECWAKADYVNQGSGANAIISLGGDITDANAGGLTSTSSVFGFWVGGANIATGSYVAKSWNHIVGVRSGSTLTIYLNGAQVTTGTNSNSITNASPKEIGRDAFAGLRFYQNQLANPRIYNRALTAAEVLRNYNADRPKFGL